MNRDDSNDARAIKQEVEVTSVAEQGLNESGWVLVARIANGSRLRLRTRFVPTIVEATPRLIGHG